jgi:WD40 repeat protein
MEGYVQDDRNSGYDAFISYSQAVNGELAPMLQNWLERFATPWYRPRSLRIFRDYTSLSASESLGQSLEDALAVSRWLVLLASPEAASSRWVNREVYWWRQHKSGAQVCVVLTAGELHWDDKTNDWNWERTTALPPAAQGMFSEQPLWVDLTSVEAPKQLDRSNPVLLNSVAQIAAPLRGVDKDALVGEHIRLHRRARQQRRWGFTGLVTFAVAAVIAGAAAMVQTNNAEIQRGVALLQRDIATSRQLAANAELESNSNPQLAALLSSAAYVIYDTPEARTSLLHQLDHRARGPAHIERFLSAQAGPLHGISFSPDGRTLAAAGEKVVLWDWARGTPLDTLPGIANRIAFSPRGNTLAVSDGDNVELWDVTQSVRLMSFPGHAGAIAFSPDGTRLAIGGIGLTTIEVWDVARGVRAGSLILPPRADAPQEGLGNSALAFSPSGRSLVADASYQGAVVFDIENAAVISSLQTENPCVPYSLAFSPDQQTVAAGCSAHTATIVLWNTQRGAELARLQANGDVGSLAFSPDGLTLASGDSTNHLVLWDMSKYTLLDSIEGHTGEVTGVAFSPDGQTLASSSLDANVMISKLGSRSPIPAEKLQVSGTPVAFNRTGKLLALSSGAGGSDALIWDLRSQTEVAVLSAAGKPLTFVSDDRLLVTSREGFAVWDIALGKRLSVLRIPAAAADAGYGPFGARPVATTEDGRLIATIVGDGKKLVVWDVERDTVVTSIPLPRGVSSLAFGRNGHILAVGEAFGPVTVWDISNSKQLAELVVQTLGGSIVTVAASSDGRLLASLQPTGQPQTGCVGCEVILWDIDHQTRVATLSGHTVQPHSIAFSTDGQTLASIGGNETILWSVPQRSPMATLSAATGQAIFSHDGRALATGNAGDGGSVLLWDTDPASWRKSLCTIAGRDLTQAEWSSYLPERPYQSVCGT